MQALWRTDGPGVTVRLLRWWLRAHPGTRSLPAVRVTNTEALNGYGIQSYRGAKSSLQAQVSLAPVPVTSGLCETPVSRPGLQVRTGAAGVLLVHPLGSDRYARRLEQHSLPVQPVRWIRIVTWQGLAQTSLA